MSAIILWYAALIHLGVETQSEYNLVLVDNQF